MESIAFQKNILTSSLFNEVLEQQLQSLYRNDEEKAALAYMLLLDEHKRAEFELINECINVIRRNIAYGNYRVALNFLVILQNRIVNFKSNSNSNLKKKKK